MRTIKVMGGGLSHGEQIIAVPESELEPLRDLLAGEGMWIEELELHAFRSADVAFKWLRSCC